MRRVTLRIVPFLMVCYFVSFLDRVNLGFAALQMVQAGASRIGASASVKICNPEKPAKSGAPAAQPAGNY